MYVFSNLCGMSGMGTDDCCLGLALSRSLKSACIPFPCASLQLLPGCQPTGWACLLQPLLLPALYVPLPPSVTAKDIFLQPHMIVVTQHLMHLFGLLPKFSTFPAFLGIV